VNKQTATESHKHSTIIKADPELKTVYQTVNFKDVNKSVVGFKLTFGKYLEEMDLYTSKIQN